MRGLRVLSIVKALGGAVRGRKGGLQRWSMPRLDGEGLDEVMKRYVVRLTGMERLMAKFGEKEMKFYLARFVDRMRLLGKISFELPLSIGSITAALLMEEELEALRLNIGLPGTVTVGAFLVRNSFDSERRTRATPFAGERVISYVHKGVGLSRRRRSELSFLWVMVKVMEESVVDEGLGIRVEVAGERE
ncbi:unnamed protein product [Sphenostylis stenocarpa]|uniref:Uncharacterized protein n=1 Tax=Sphenostylis stenocarpa TaxID=92480 RepID=A0AA86SZB9_9FABA|nr:unnamed protein product [Sphenostylis stenocarpa]